MSVAELLAALRKLDPERLARAEAQGYDTSKVYFHGGNSDIAAVDPSYFGKGSDIYGPGFYSTQSSTHANNFTNGLRGTSEGGNVMPVFLNKENHLDLSRNPLSEANQNRYLNLLGEDAMMTGEYPNMQMTKHFAKDEVIKDPQRYLDKASGAGISGYTPSDVMSVTYDPSKIRSIFAKFDPAKADSSDLLASLAGAGALGTAFSPDQAEAMPLKHLSPEEASTLYNKVAKLGDEWRDSIDPKRPLASFVDDSGFTSHIFSGVPESEKFWNVAPHYTPRHGINIIENPKGKIVRGGYWMNWPEEEWNISKDEWSKMTPEQRAEKEVEQQATAYQPLKDQFDFYKKSSPVIGAGLLAAGAGAMGSSDDARASTHGDPDGTPHWYQPALDKAQAYQDNLLGNVSEQANNATSDVAKAFDSSDSMLHRLGHGALGTLEGIGIPETSLLDTIISNTYNKPLAYPETANMD